MITRGGVRTNGRRRSDTAVPSSLLLAGVCATLLPACATFTLPTTQGPGRDVPAQLYGLGPGPTTVDVLRHGGWTFADAKENAQTYILGSPGKDVSDVEAIVLAPAGAPPVVQFIRLRYAATRLSTYRELLQSLIAAHGYPQESVEVPHFELFEADQNTEAPRPPSFVVHRWHGRSSDLVLVAGLEHQENLISSMQYQLFLLPPAVGQTAASR